MIRWWLNGTQNHGDHEEHHAHDNHEEHNYDNDEGKNLYGQEVYQLECSKLGSTHDSRPPTQLARRTKNLALINFKKFAERFGEWNDLTPFIVDFQV